MKKKKNLAIIDLISKEAKQKFGDTINILIERYKKFGLFRYETIEELLSVRSMIDLGIPVSTLEKEIGCPRGFIEKIRDMDMDELTKGLYSDKMKKILDNAYEVVDDTNELIKSKYKEHPELIQAKDVAAINDIYFKRIRLITDKSTENVAGNIVYKIVDYGK
jgi:hypothetical protein